jgi:4-diphosphocytidyl-2-C-methyl-D-erythritol kinase
VKKTYHSPAKINLFLKVLSKRPDGYHNLVSLVDIISIYDMMHVETIAEDVIIIEDDKGILPDGEANTIYRAAKLLKEVCNIHSGVRIFVEKNIPIGSGLGGPSSNAATTLKALVAMWRLTIPEQELNSLGSRIGADVPLFLHGGSCIMEGIGDIITPVTLPPFWYVVVYPGVAISTKEVYGRLKIVLTNEENDYKLMGNFKNIGDIADNLKNDLEQVGIVMCPTIKMIKEKLIEAGASGSMMSGSGSSVFGIFENEKNARKAAHYLGDMGGVFVGQSIR